MPQNNKKVKFEITKKTGAPAKPSETGFQKYASNRIKIELAVKNIIENISKKITRKSSLCGNVHTHMAVFQKLCQYLQVCVQNCQSML